MCLIRKNTIVLIGGVLAAMLVVASAVFLVLRSDKLLEIDNLTPALKPARTQEEIWTEYAKNINRLLVMVNNSEESAEIILGKVGAGFFDIFVPTEKKDLHIQTLLKIQKLKSDGSIDSREKMREYMVPLLSALLERN